MKTPAPDRARVVAAAIVAGGSARRLGGIDKGSLLIAGRSILDRQLEVLLPRFSRVLLVLAPTAGPAGPWGNAPPRETLALDSAPSPTDPTPHSSPSPSASHASLTLPSSPPPAASHADLALVLPKFTVIRDRRERGQGPLAGIEAALAALLQHEEAVVCIAGDMPLLQPPLLDLLRDHHPEAVAVVPRVGQPPAAHAEPLLARYGRACAPEISAALERGAFKAASLIETLGPEWLDESQLRAADPDLLSLENANTTVDLTRIEALAQAFDPAAWHERL